MAKIEPPIHLNTGHDDVLIFGKSPEQKISDLEKGISRLGGRWRVPSYKHAYLKASQLLINEAIKNDSLDQVGLPIFYLQRHTIELCLKELLSIAYSIVESRNNKNESEHVQITLSKEQINRLNTEHKIHSLYCDLKKICNSLYSRDLPDEFELLIKKIISFENTDPTWSRYSKKKDKSKHIVHEIEIPIKEIQSQIDKILQVSDYSLTSKSNSIFDDIYEEFYFLIVSNVLV
jgi:hypothetical protein